jgi:dTDP-glucose 4,6-dehydratase
VTIARPFNTYGPRQSARAVIPTIITQIASRARQIRIGAITPTRDFNYIDDTVSGFISLAESDHTVGEVVNLGSNFEISIRDTALEISELMNTQIDIETQNQRNRPEKSEVQRLCADNKRAAELSGWRPEYSGRTGFRRGLKKTIEWFVNPENLEMYKADIYNV